MVDITGHSEKGGYTLDARTGGEKRARMVQVRKLLKPFVRRMTKARKGAGGGARRVKTRDTENGEGWKGRRRILDVYTKEETDGRINIYVNSCDLFLEQDRCAVVYHT